MKTKLSKTETDEPFECSKICCVRQVVKSTGFRPVMREFEPHTQF